MKIRLPKDLRPAGISLVSPFDLNTFDIDLILPAIFFAVISEGRARARPKANDPEKVDEYVDKLSKHQDLAGFQTPEGRRVLGRLVRTSLAVMGVVGRSRVDEQIVAVVPFSLLAHKPGFPTMTSRLRGVDAYVFRTLRDRMGSPDRLKEVFKEYFGKGVSLRPVPVLGGGYDGTTRVDVLTRMHLAFMDVFDTTAAVERRRERGGSDLCLGVTSEIGDDLLRYLFVYNDRMPVEELTRKFIALLNFELFIYTLKLVDGLKALVKDPRSLPSAFASQFLPSLPEIYVDFTRSPISLSSEVSAACVRRDLESLSQFMRASRLVRQLDLYMAGLRRRNPSLAATDGVTPAARIQWLLQMPSSEFASDISAAARIDENRIRIENTPEAEGDLDPFAEVDAVLATATDDLERVVHLILESQGKSVYQSLSKWYWGTGGLTKQFGLLSGRLKGRASWRYQASDELLVVLVQLAAARLAGLNNDHGPRRPIRLRELLDFLWHRFGIAIGRTIAPYDGAEYAAAARENLQSMLARLRQMGMFNDLSDDFTVQTLTVELSDRRES